MAAMIGTMLPVWNELVVFLRANFLVEEDFKFMYGKNYGWALRFRVNGKFLTSLFPTKGGFTVQVNLTPQAVEQAIKMDIHPGILEVINNAHPYPEGRWCFIPVWTPQALEDIKQLIRLRATTKNIPPK
jgi:hypothetical protein